jgi:hypothetical protein
VSLSIQDRIGYRIDKAECVVIVVRAKPHCGD